ncbi:MULTISPECIES: FtsK/SpoIIIE domain-containing protein [Pseudofrankia]|uniref:FtsK/SpoIIIE domain-containing protein n=1 Tax=Pseudofrankia TaxID=2994363 RepID=UPI000234CB66|nr:MULTISPECIES: FtsK/SpoIIIE domain-containing protein [Pseudofrankia]OHV30747.1 cell division protein FtsK [Pseudofrankia sp. EUN1h]
MTTSSVGPVPLTVVLPSGAQLDVALAAKPSTTIATVAAGLARDLADDLDAAPSPASDLFLDGARLDPLATLRESGLAGGARLGVGGPASPVGPEPPWRDTAASAVDGEQLMTRDPHWYEVHAVGGPHAGQVWAVGPGAHGIGSAAGCPIRLDGLPERGPVLHVGHTGDTWVSWPAPDSSPALARTPTAVSPSAAESRQHAARLARPFAAPVRRTDEHQLATNVNHHGDPRRKPGRPAGRAASTAAPGDTTFASNDLTPNDLTFNGNVSGAGTADRAVAGRPAASRPWPVDVDLAVGDTLLRLVDPFEPDAAVTPSVDVVGRDFNRPPRIVPPLLYSRQRYPSPPSTPTRRPIPLVMMLSPLVMGVAFVWLFGSTYFLIIMAMAPLMGVANWYTDRRGGRRQFRLAAARYRARRAEVDRELAEAVTAERHARSLAAPDPATAWLMATGPGGRLWERRRADPDHLVLRVGTADQPSLIEVEDPAVDGYSREVRWTVPDVPVLVDVAGRGVIGVAGPAETVAGLARWLVAQACVLHSPRDLRVEILADVLGEARWDWVRWLPHARPNPADGPAPGAPYAFVGTDPETVAHRVSELVALVKARTKARGSTMGQVLFREPDVVVVLDGARRLRDVPGVVQVLKEGPAVRVFALCLDADERLLPEECAAVVRVDGDGLTVRQSDAPELRGVRQDLVTPDWCDQVSRAMCPLRDVTPDDSGGLPGEVRLLDLLGLADVAPDGMASRIADAWRGRPATTAFPLGAGFDGPFVLDLVRDGPHALVAGTTGAGKSELLQTLVASLAARNHPDELGFVLIDYKGGSAFHGCVRLPHTLGMVTDLDAALAARALESLAAELRRREEVLAAATAKDLAHYRALRAKDPTLPPLGRLVIVIDEFATLVGEVREFVPGLVSLAQRGRSLGVHLVLATQRPGGAVTADIRANTNLRIALRVTDTHESSDVIDTVDAAFVPAATPGRALVRLAARSSVPFQTAYAGGRYEPPPPPVGTDAEGLGGAGDTGGVVGPRSAADAGDAPSVRPVAAVPLRWTSLGRPLPFTGEEPAAAGATEAVATDLDVLVDAVRAAALLDGADPGGAGRPSPWLPPLGTRLLVDDLVARLRDLGYRAPDRATTARTGALPAVPYALADLPALQRQVPVLCDLAASGHLGVIGTPRSGRSQVLRTLAGALAGAISSADVHFYGIDAGGGALAVLAELPHTGAVVPAGDLERLARLLERLAAEVSRRQALLGRHSCAGLAELRGVLPVPERPAHLILFIDGWDSLAATLGEHDGGRLHELLLALLREGAGVGVHLVMTSERALLTGRAATLVDSKLVLRMTERSDYMTIHVQPARVPAVVPPGRGWRAEDQAEVQVALLALDASGQAQAEALRQIGASARAAETGAAGAGGGGAVAAGGDNAGGGPAGRAPFPVAALPESVTFADAYAQVAEADRRPLRALLGLGGDDAAPLVVDLAGRAHTFLVAGPPGAGRSTALATLAVSLLAGGTALAVVTPRESPLRRLAAHADVRLLTGPVFSGDDLTAALAELGAAAADGTGNGAGKGRPVAVLVDDVDLLGYNNPLEPPLRAVVATGRDRGVGLAFAGSGETLGQALGGWLAEAKRSRQGVLLSPQSSVDGDLIGTRIPQSLLRTGIRPGRGHVVDAMGVLRTITIPHTVLR